MKTIPPTLLELLQEAVPEAKLHTDDDGDRPLGEIGVDSLDKMALLLAVQEKYDLEFTEAEIKELRTLRDIAKKIPA